jgi:hypothetical protein
LSALERINADFIAAVLKGNPSCSATLDMDATLIATEKKHALFSYKGFKAYQPLNTYWAEQGLILHAECRVQKALPQQEHPPTPRQAIAEAAARRES